MSIHLKSDVSAPPLKFDLHCRPENEFELPLFFHRENVDAIHREIYLIKSYVGIWPQFWDDCEKLCRYMETVFDVFAQNVRFTLHLHGLSSISYSGTARRSNLSDIRSNPYSGPTRRTNLSTLSNSVGFVVETNWYAETLIPARHVCAKMSFMLTRRVRPPSRPSGA